MKKLIPLLILFILLIPETKKSVDKYFLYGSEGMVAVQMCATEDNEPTPIPGPDKPDGPTKYKCNTCKDTGIIKPDGVVEIPCPDCRVPKDSKCDCSRACGIEGCRCKTTQRVESKKEEVVKIARRVVLFTQPDRCPPCREYDNNVVPKLKAKGITVGNKGTDDIQVLDPTRPVAHPLWTQYGHLGGGGVPLFLAFEGDKLVGHSSGAISEGATLKLLGK